MKEPDLTLVPCHRFHCRITERSCVRRWKAEHRKGNAAKPWLNDLGCRGCEVGRERSKQR